MATYLSEMMGGFFLAFQSTLIYYFLDNFASNNYQPSVAPAAVPKKRSSMFQQEIKIIRKAKKGVDITGVKHLIRILLSIYTIIVIVRVVLYLQIMKYCDQLSSTPQLYNHFGMLLGNVFENKGVAILATLLILLCICSCFGLSLTSIQYLKEIESIVSKRSHIQNDDYILPWQGSSSISSIDMSPLIVRETKKEEIV